MPEKKYMPEGQARPVDFTHEEVAAFSAGHLPENLEVSGRLEQVQRPKELSQSAVEALVAGKEIRLEELPETGQRAARTEAAERPADLTQKDVDAAVAGKAVDLAQKRRLLPQ